MPRLNNAQHLIKGEQRVPVGTVDLGPFPIGDSDHWSLQWYRVSAAIGARIRQREGVGIITSIVPFVTSQGDPFLNTTQSDFRTPPNVLLTERQNPDRPYFVNPAGLTFTTFPTLPGTEEGDYIVARENPWSQLMLRLTVTQEAFGLYIVLFKASTGN